MVLYRTLLGAGDARALDPISTRLAKNARRQDFVNLTTATLKNAALLRQILMLYLAKNNYRSLIRKAI